MRWALLEGVPEQERNRVLSVAVRRRYARGETVFHEGDVGDTLHLIESGLVAVRRTTTLGQVATLAVAGPGEVFGELALVSPEARRSATITALERTDTLVLHRAQFEQLRRSHPTVDRFLVQILAAALERSNARLSEAFFVPADTRVLRRLLELVAHYDRRTGQVDVPLTQETLAEMAGSTRSTVNRVLQRAVEQGAVALRRGHVVVLDTAYLRRHAR